MEKETLKIKETAEKKEAAETGASFTKA